MRSWPVSVVLGLVVGGCADIAGFDGNPQMNPGKDCLVCHSASGQASNLTFSVGGTVYPRALAGTEGGLFNAEIDITDSTGRNFVLHSNGAGNFYSAEPIVFPAAVSVKVGGQIFAMTPQPSVPPIPRPSLAPNGHCNACHAVSTNPDGTLWPSPLPGFAKDAGFSNSPPGHIYGFCSTCAGTSVAACPSPAPSYSNQVGAIVAANCRFCHPAEPRCCQTNTPCGDAGLCPQDPALDDYPDILAGSPRASSEVGGGVMPPPGDTWFPMSPDERQILLSWFACNSPDN